MAEADGLSIDRQNWRHSLNSADFTWTPYEPVYGDSLAGNLELHAVETAVPLQQGSYGYRETGLPVSIGDVAALFAPEQRVVGPIMPSTHSTAAGTPFGRVPTVYHVQRNPVVETSAFQNPSEKTKRDSHDLPIEASSLWPESCEPFYRDICIVVNRKTYDISGDLSDLILYKIAFLAPRGSELLSCRYTSRSVLMRPEEALPLEYLLPSFPELLPEVYLLQDLSLRAHNSDREAFTIDVDPEEILSWIIHALLFREICHDLKVGGNAECLALPSPLNQHPESFKVPVVPDRNGYSPTRIETEFYKEKGLGLKGPAISWDVELDRHAVNMLTSSLLPPDSPGQVADYLDVEPSIPLRSKPHLPPKTSEIRVVFALFEHVVGFGDCSMFKFGKNAPLGIRDLGLQQDCPLHPCAQARNFTSHLTTHLPIPPAGKLYGSPWESK